MDWYSIRKPNGSRSPYRATVVADDEARTITVQDRSGSIWVVDYYTETARAVTPHARTLPAYAVNAAIGERAAHELRQTLPPGSTVYTMLHHVSRSGMRRRIGLRAISGDSMLYLDSLAARALGEPRPEDGLVVDGCGMDMGFNLVYCLSVRLYCPNDYDQDAAYALNQRWI
jgi:hypothetical protein